EEQAAWSRRLGMVPTTASGLARAGRLAREVYAALASATPLPRHPASAALFDDLNPAVAAVVAGDATAAEAIARVRRAWARLLGRLGRDIPVLARLVIVDGDGAVIAGGALPGGVDLAARSFGGYVGDALFTDGHPRVPLVVQARSRTGELVGFFVAEIDLGF